jgi:hypothetical protein
MRIEESCESLLSKFLKNEIKPNEPSCLFTTGFLNGFYSAIKNQHVKETKCIGLGDPYCEWEFRWVVRSSKHRSGLGAEHPYCDSTQSLMLIFFCRVESGRIHPKCLNRLSRFCSIFLSLISSNSFTQLRRVFSNKGS